MKAEEFRNWLESGNIQKIKSKNTIDSRVSACRKIEKSKYDLESEYKKDSGKGLIQLLTYSKEDFRKNLRPKHRIEINGDFYTGTATLKRSAKLYFLFCEYSNRKVNIPNKVKVVLGQINENKNLKREEKKVLSTSH